jgi:hypothetical protein
MNHAWGWARQRARAVIAAFSGPSVHSGLQKAWRLRVSRNGTASHHSSCPLALLNSITNQPTNHPPTTKKRPSVELQPG